MSATTRLIAAAAVSLLLGVGGSYATLHASVTCSVAALQPGDDGKAFLAGPDLPLTGPRYK